MEASSSDQVNIKQEQITPERDESKDLIETLLDSNLFGKNDDSDDHKEIKQSK